MIALKSEQGSFVHDVLEGTPPFDLVREYALPIPMRHLPIDGSRGPLLANAACSMWLRIAEPCC